MESNKKYYYIYIVQCNDGTFYIGITTDLLRRLREHNGEILGGAKYTRTRRPIILRYYEKCNNRSEALTKEFSLKKKTRKDKIILCDQFTCVI